MKNVIQYKKYAFYILKKKNNKNYINFQTCSQKSAAGGLLRGLAHKKGLHLELERYFSPKSVEDEKIKKRSSPEIRAIFVSEFN